MGVLRSPRGLSLTGKTKLPHALPGRVGLERAFSGRVLSRKGNTASTGPDVEVHRLQGAGDIPDGDPEGSWCQWASYLLWGWSERGTGSESPPVW